MHQGLRYGEMPRHNRGFLSTLCVVLSAAALLAACPGAGQVSADDGTTTLKVYFGKEDLGERDAACSEVAAVVRQVPRTQGVARAALQELFRGPTPEEREAGYRSWFSDSTRAILKDVRIADGTAYVDLHDVRQLLSGATSSCGSVEFFSQVEATLKQFTTVDRVILAIEGQPRLFYDWIDMEYERLLRRQSFLICTRRKAGTGALEPPALVPGESAPATVQRTAWTAWPA